METDCFTRTFCHVEVHQFQDHITQPNTVT